jgi:predicted GNAT family N-acyltransferase
MRTAEITIKWATGADEMHGALSVREQVFCNEQGVSRAEELDGLDDGALHLVAQQQGGPIVGTLRLLSNGNEAKIGRVAVDRDWRRQGLASMMLELAIAKAKDLGCTKVRLASQLDATGVYERAGFTVESGEFEDAGILHVWMGLQLTPEPTQTDSPRNPCR